MKKLILTLIFSCLSLCGYAQEHLYFKGIPIEGSLSTFCQKLKNKGFSSIATEGNISLFKGNFTGRQATVGVIATDNGHDVFKVIVSFDETDSWNTLVSTYEHYKELYIEKYGEPSKSVENNPSRSDSNTSLMYELYQGRVTYASIFEVTGGDIFISIIKSSYNSGKVMIMYQDTQNINAKKQRDLDDI